MRLRELRQDDRRWAISVLSGPNLRRLDLGDDLRSLDDLAALLGRWGEDLGVELDHFGSNHEGRLLEHIHSRGDDTDGYLVNPGGLIRVGESLRHALRETKRPVVEVHLDNVTELGGGSIFTPGVIGICSGLRQFSYLAALVGLVLGLDDPSFLHPDGSGESNRAHGVPRSLFE